MREHSLQKLQRLGLVLLSFCLYMAASSSHAASIRVGYAGEFYDVSLQAISFDTSAGAFVLESAAFEEQLWWGDEAMATYFSNAVGDRLGIVNYRMVDGIPPEQANLGAAFIYENRRGLSGTRNSFWSSGACYDPASADTDACRWALIQLGSQFLVSGTDAFAYAAVAVKVDEVPLPAAAWMFLSACAGLAWRVRRNQ